ncbi:MAG: GIY-YIG nuclease family protein [Mariprofundaceae bacterium]
MSHPDQITDTVWHLYMIRLNNGHLYTGITTDVERRFKEHQAGKGAKYLRGKGELKLVYKQSIGTQSNALKIESKVKKLNKHEKEQLILGKEQLPTS